MMPQNIQNRGANQFGDFPFPPQALQGQQQINFQQPPGTPVQQLQQQQLQQQQLQQFSGMMPQNIQHRGANQFGDFPFPPQALQGQQPINFQQPGGAQIPQLLLQQQLQQQQLQQQQLQQFSGMMPQNIQNRGANQFGDFPFPPQALQ
eukprot:Tbor_TRINITY_DN4936_c0_g2::TRINITY_DN4936_c0_g2_i2::g.9771::m.9771